MTKGGDQPGARPGLRERKKQRTHDDLQRIATRLFLERGYDEVTVEEIAAAADVSHRTFYRYFTSKDALVLGDLDDVVALVQETLDERPDDEPIIDAIRAVSEEMVALFTGDVSLDRARVELIERTPALRERQVERQPRLEGALIPFVARRLGVDPETDLLPRLVAACILAATRAALDTWKARGSTEPIGDLIADAFRWVEAGFGDRLQPTAASSTPET